MNPAINQPRYSIIIPVYNRAEELEELLESLTKQSVKDFEVIVVDDGSAKPADFVIERFHNVLTIRYFFKTNAGPGPARNFGFTHAAGDYFIVFDSDCIIPPQYLEVVEQSLQQNKWDAWGGPDRAHEKFTPLQRAMGYTMSSVLTTGGIRGGKKRLGWFQPRSFNMGISRRVFSETGGFSFDRFAEDIEFSIRMRKGNFNVGLIPDAYVYHKRRTTLSQFYDQVYNFGRGRALVGKAHPGEVKLTHWIPSIFLLGVFSLLVLPFLYSPLFFIGLFILIIYFLAIFIDSFRVNRDIEVALLSIPSAWLQLTGYGLGFLSEHFKK